MTLLASVLVVIPTLFFLVRPEWMFAWNEVLASAILMVITMVGVSLFIILTYLIERRKKYALITLVFGVFLLLFFATIVISTLSFL